MNNKIQETQKRLFRYDYVDGTPDLAFGGLCLAVAICFFLFAAFPGLSSSTFSAVIVWVVLGGGGLLISWLSQRLKERLTYPRTGYVAYSRQGRPIKRTTQLLIRIGLPLLTIILLAVLFLNRQKVSVQSQDQVTYLNPGLMGFLFSGLIAIIGWKIHLLRYYLIAAAVFLLSTVFLISGSSGNLGLALISGSMSLILFVSGGVTLWQYLHNTHLPVDASSENQEEL
jgi:hypothetical protein